MSKEIDNWYPTSETDWKIVRETHRALYGCDFDDPSQAAVRKALSIKRAARTVHSNEIMARSTATVTVTRG
jgi:hypothetical protein